MSVCSFKGCNNSKRFYPNLHMFSFPVRNKERCMAWVKNAECPEKLAHLTLKQLGSASKGICALHFKQSSFMNYLCCSLNKFAVPVAGYINEDLLPMLSNDKTKAEIHKLLAQRDPKVIELHTRKFVSCDPEPVVSECASSSALSINTERDPLDTVEDLAAGVGRQYGGSNRKEAKCGATAERQDMVTKMHLVDALSKHLSGPPLTLFKMQMLRSGHNDTIDEWALEEKELALIMYYKSAPLYKYMRDKLHFVLPSDADIKYWIECTKRIGF